MTLPRSSNMEDAFQIVSGLFAAAGSAAPERRRRRGRPSPQQERGGVVVVAVAVFEQQDLRAAPVGLDGHDVVLVLQEEGVARAALVSGVPCVVDVRSD